MNSRLVRILLVAAAIVTPLCAAPLDVTLKDLEHQWHVKGDPSGAARRALDMVSTQSGDTNQQAMLIGLAAQAALASKDTGIMRDAAERCRAYGLPCDGLSSALVTIPATRVTNLLFGAGIPSALEYQWDSLDWRTSSTDYAVFDEYLEELSERKDVPESARIEAALLRTAMRNWLRHGVALGITEAMVRRHYQRLLDALWFQSKQTFGTDFRDGLERWYEAACEYIRDSQPYLALAAVQSFGAYANAAAAECSGPKLVDGGYRYRSDIERVQLARIGKIAASVYRQTPQLERFFCISALVGFMDMEALGSNAFEAVTITERNPNVNLMSVPLPTGSTVRAVLSHLVKSDEVSQYIALTDIVYDADAPVANIRRRVRGGGDLLTVQAITCSWPTAVWERRFAAVSNDIWQLEAPLNEYRAYIDKTYEEPRREQERRIARDDRLWFEMTNAWNVFVKEGPLETPEAFRARDEVLRAVKERKPNSYAPLMELIGSYPLTCDVFRCEEFALPVKGQDWLRWNAWQLLRDLQRTQAAVDRSDDSELTAKLLRRFMEEFPSLCHPYEGLTLVSRFARNLAMGNAVTSLFPYIHSQLELVVSNAPPNNPALDIASATEEIVITYRSSLSAFHVRGSLDWALDGVLDSPSWWSKVRPYGPRPIVISSLRTKMMSMALEPDSEYVPERQSDPYVSLANAYISGLRMDVDVPPWNPSGTVSAVLVNADWVERLVPFFLECQRVAPRRWIAQPLLSDGPVMLSTEAVARRDVTLERLKTLAGNPSPQNDRESVQTLMDYVRGLRADAGAPAEGIDWLSRLGLTNAAATFEHGTTQEMIEAEKGQEDTKEF